MRRRTALGGLAALGALGGGAAWLLRGREAGIAAEVEAILRRSFGDTVAADPEARRFISDFEASLTRAIRNAGGGPQAQAGPPRPAAPPDPAFQSRLEERVVTLFLEGSNVVIATEYGDPLAWFGFRDPYAQPCLNPVGAMALEAVEGA